MNLLSQLNQGRHLHLSFNKTTTHFDESEDVFNSCQGNQAAEKVWSPNVSLTTLQIVY